MRELVHFDFDHLCKTLEVDAAMGYKTVARFYATQPQVLANIESSVAHVLDPNRVDDDAWAPLVMHPHSLKSAARTIGAHDLARCAEALEHAARRREMARIATLHEELRAQYKATMGDVKHFLLHASPPPGVKRTVVPKGTSRASAQPPPPRAGVEDGS
jgi:HPt (histidine-containing phosphotransfer) domain-containing protein